MLRKVTASIAAAPQRTLQGVANICRRFYDTNAPGNAYCINEVRLLGNVGGDVREVQLRDGRSIVTFNMATNMTYQVNTKDGLQENRRRTDWHDIHISRPSVRDYASDNIQVGDQVFVMGRSQRTLFRDEEGKVTGSQQYVNADRVYLLRKRGASSSTVDADHMNEHVDEFDDVELEDDNKRT